MRVKTSATVIKKARFTNFGEDMELFDWFGSPVSWWADSFRPSTDWSKGGPLMDSRVHSFNQWKDGTYDAEVKTGACTAVGCEGHTILIASMRAIVAAELGDEVDVPEELCSE